MSIDSHNDAIGIVRSISSVVSNLVSGDSQRSKIESSGNFPFYEKCIICFGYEEEERKLIPLPCHNKCSENYVHRKCIFEWSERQNTKGSCPLCRGKLKPIHYTPVDILQRDYITNSLHTHKSFVLRPIPKEAGMIRCFLKVKQNPWWGSAYLYEFYLQGYNVKKYPYGPLPDQLSPIEGDILLVQGRKRGSIEKDFVKFNFFSTIDFSISNSFDPYSSYYLGKLKSESLIGLEYSLEQRSFLKQSRRTLFSKKRDDTLRAARIKYTQNRYGAFNGPRRLSISMLGTENLPTARISRSLLGNNQSMMLHGTKESQQVKQNEFLLSPRVPELQCSNKEPKWIDAIQAYSLDFNGRVTAASNKNFQLLFTSKTLEKNGYLSHFKSETEEIVLQFGKIVGADECRENIGVYTVDFKFPLSPYQALGICVSACDRKLGCA